MISYNWFKLERIYIIPHAILNGCIKKFPHAILDSCIKQFLHISLIQAFFVLPTLHHDRVSKFINILIGLFYKELGCYKCFDE